MDYTMLFIHFLEQVREYRFDTIQFILFPNTNKENVFKVLNDEQTCFVYQVKYTQVFEKTVSFNELENTIVDLLFNSMNQYIVDISKLNNTMKNIRDIYRQRNIYDMNVKYLNVIPVYIDSQLVGGMFIFSNYQTIWQINNKDFVDLIDGLFFSYEEFILLQLQGTCDNKYFVFKNNGYYLSYDLAEYLDMPCYQETIDFKGHSVKQLQPYPYLNGEVYPCLIVKKQNIESIVSKLDNLFTDSLVFIKKSENESFKELYNKVSKVIELIDGALGEYNWYQSNDNIVIVYKSNVEKRMIESFYNELSYILVRCGHELKKTTDYQTLVNYLDLSPVEQFNEKYFAFYVQQLITESKNQVNFDLRPTKFKTSFGYNSSNMSKDYIMLECIDELKEQSKENKYNSIYKMLTLIDDYKEFNIILNIPVDYFTHERKAYIKLVNLLKKTIENYPNILICTSYNKDIFNEVSRVFNEFLNYVIIDDNCDIYDSFLISDKCQGLYIKNEKQKKVLINNNEIIKDYTEFLLKNFKKVFIKVTQNDIIYYKKENIILIIE